MALDWTPQGRDSVLFASVAPLFAREWGRKYLRDEGSNVLCTCNVPGTVFTAL